MQNCNNVKYFFEVNPDLLSEFDFEKNILLEFKKIKQYSHKKCWWKCINGHSWQASFAKRNNTKCPYCKNKLASNINNLQIINPKLSKEWNYKKNGDITPTDVTSKSSKNVWWICNKKHEWKSPISDRSRGDGCPYCSGKRVCIDNCLETKNKKLCQEWNYEKNINITPKDITEFSLKKVWWKCNKGHEWVSSVANRSRGTGCKKCNNPNVSKIEKYFFHFFKLVFPDAENTYKFYYNSKQIEIDIFIKSINLAIECDGGYFHNKDKSIKYDKTKNLILNKLKIELIRIREHTLPSIYNHEYFYITERKTHSSALLWMGCKRHTNLE